MPLRCYFCVLLVVHPNARQINIGVEIQVCLPRLLCCTLTVCVYLLIHTRSVVGGDLVSKVATAHIASNGIGAYLIASAKYPGHNGLQIVRSHLITLSNWGQCHSISCIRCKTDRA